MKAPLAALALLASVTLLTPAAPVHAQDHAVLADPLPELLVKLQGTWKGQETGRDGACRLVFKGSAMSYTGPEKGEWYKGIAMVTAGVEPAQLSGKITEAGATEAVGKTALAIVKLEGDKLTLVTHGPGAEAAPKSFEGDADSHTFVFHKAEKAD